MYNLIGWFGEEPGIVGDWEGGSLRIDGDMEAYREKVKCKASGEGGLSCPLLIVVDGGGSLRSEFIVLFELRRIPVFLSSRDDVLLSKDKGISA